MYVGDVEEGGGGYVEERRGEKGKRGIGGGVGCEWEKERRTQ